MKSAWLTTLPVVLVLLLAPSGVEAVETAALDGTTFSVTLYCAEDLGEYCRKGDIKHDRFVFEDGAFAIEYFSKELSGLLGSGSFSERGVTFEADYQATRNLLSEYQFDVQGISLLGRVLIGSADAVFKEWVLAIPPRFETQDAAKLFFFGFRD